MLTALAAGWSGFALPLLVLLILMSQPLYMLAMKVVFKAFGVPQEEQAKWVLKKSERNGMLDLARPSGTGSHSGARTSMWPSR